LIRLCKDYKININLPGNNSFDPKLPDATASVKNFFPTRLGQLCSLPNAYITFKKNQRELLDIDDENTEGKMNAKERMLLEEQRVNLMAIAYNGKGV